MPNPYFRFKQFTVYQNHCSMKVTTDSCLFGAWVANDIKGLGINENILDIGSGSGLLSLMLAQQINASIDGIEIQESDFAQSIENIYNSNFKNNITIHHANAVEYNYSKKYDVIVSNPPFYENELKAIAPEKNIAHHSERLKIQQLVALIKKLSTQTGSFYLLLPAKRKEALEELVANAGLHINTIVFVHQTEKHPPFRIMVKGSFVKYQNQSEGIYIKEKENYSSGFISLLKDYYLHL